MNISKKHYIIIICLIVAISMTILFSPMSPDDSRDSPADPSGKENTTDISNHLEESIKHLKNPTNPVKINISTENKTSSYYYSSRENKQMELTTTETKIIYKTQTEENIHIITHTTESPVSTRETTRSISIAKEEQKVNFIKKIDNLRELLEDYNATQAIVKKETGPTVYKLMDKKEQSTESITVTLGDNKLQKISTTDKTIKIIYNADEIEKPEPPEADTDGEEEERDCSDLDHC